MLEVILIFSQAAGLASPEPKEWHDFIGEGIAFLALITSGYALWKTSRSNRFLVYQSLLTSYDDIGPRMTLVGEWIQNLSDSSGDWNLTEKQIRKAMDDHLKSVKARSVDSNSALANDELNLSRRSVKNWFVRCWKAYERRQINLEQLQSLFPDERLGVLWYSVVMTRAQYFDRHLPYDDGVSIPETDDEEKFKLIARKGFAPRGLLSDVIR